MCNKMLLSAFLIPLPRFSCIYWLIHFNPRKASQITDIPLSTIKENKDVIALFIYHNFNKSPSSSYFLTGLKYVDVRPVCKNNIRTNKEKYRRSSILPNVREAYEQAAVSLLKWDFF